MVPRKDHVADVNGAELARLAQRYDIPNFVKQASWEETFRAEHLPTTVFADAVRRQFPCHTPASTWLSALYYQEKAGEFHPNDRKRIESRLQRFASFWGIKAAVDRMQQQWKRHQQQEDASLSDSDFAYVWVGDHGHKERHLRLKTAAEVRHAAEYLQKWQDSFPYAIRHRMATKILTRAAALGADLGGPLQEFLEKQAGRGICDPGEVADMVQRRAFLVKNAELKKHFLLMAEEVRRAPRVALLPDLMTKLAETIDQLDREYLGLAGHYSELLPRPEDVLFKVTFSKAAAAISGHVTTTTGSTYEKSSLGAVPVEELRSVFGDEFVERVACADGGAVDPEKLAEEAAALPRPEAELLDRLLQQCGVKPVLKKSAASRPAHLWGHLLDPAEARELAEAYIRSLPRHPQSS